MNIPPRPKLATTEAVDLEVRMEAWRRFVLIANPMANADHVRKLAEDIVGRANVLSIHYPVRFYDVALFFLERTQGWVMNGIALDQIGGKMPKNLDELGVLMMTEGSQERFGGPLTAKELAPVIKASKKIIH